MSPGDTFGYGVYAYNNSEELISIVDHIYLAYRLDILERDIFENKIFRIRISSIRETINFTELWTEIFNFSYPLGIARILTTREVPIKWPLLPFAVPVGYWDDLIDTLKRLALIENIHISYAYKELASEYEFNITLSLGSQIIYLCYVWSERTGVLDAANIIVMQNDNYDAPHIVLESIFFQRERNPKNILYTILSLLLILVGITSLTLSLKRISPLEKVRNFLESRKKKIIKQKRIMRKSILSKNPDYELIRKVENHEMLRIILVVLSAILGYATVPILISIRITSRIDALIKITMLILTPVSLVIISELYKRKTGLYYLVEGDLYYDTIIMNSLAYMISLGLWVISIVLFGKPPLIMILIITGLSIVLAIALLTIAKDILKEKEKLLHAIEEPNYDRTNPISKEAHEK